MNLKEQKTAVIVGATGGIGREVATHLLDAGMNLYLMGRKIDALRSHLNLSENIEDKMVNYCKVDLNSEDQIINAIDSIQEQEIDFFIYCAANFSYGSFENANIDDFDKSYRVNMRAPYLLIQKILPKIISAKGVIAILNSNVVMNSGNENLLHYASTKSGLKTMADCLRQELNNEEVCVVTFLMGKVATSMQQRVLEQKGLPYKAEKMVQPKQVAKLIYQTLTVSDGMEITDIHVRPSVKYE